jgi:hypothetical protein
LLRRREQARQDRRQAERRFVWHRSRLLNEALLPATIHFCRQLINTALNACDSLLPLRVAHPAECRQMTMQLRNLSANGFFGRGNLRRITPIDTPEPLASLPLEPSRIEWRLQIAIVHRQRPRLSIGCQHAPVARQNAPAFGLERDKGFDGPASNLAECGAVVQLQLHGTPPDHQQGKCVTRQNPAEPPPWTLGRHIGSSFFRQLVPINFVDECGHGGVQRAENELKTVLHVVIAGLHRAAPPLEVFQTHG